MPDNSTFLKSVEEATLKMIQEESKKMEKACLILEASAKQKCPADNGVLRASLTHEVEVSATEITGRNGTNLEYGPYVHNGTGIYAKDGDGRKTPWTYKTRSGRHKGFHFTHGQRPQPFLEDAKMECKGRIERALAD